MRSLALFILGFCPFAAQGRHPTCHFLLELERDRADCGTRLKEQDGAGETGEAICRGVWDSVACWDRAEVGQTVVIPCPRALRTFFSRNGNISRRCTSEGWSEVFPNISAVCGVDTSQDQLLFYVLVQALYTVGHSLSLLALTTGSAILCLCRRLHCTRNSIHLNLFLSFIFRAVAVLLKDQVLFSRDVQCSPHGSLVGCRASLVILQYFVMANFSWLLVEGLYLHTLLLVIFSDNRHLRAYLFIGWGAPCVLVCVWALSRLYLEDTGCWETNDHPIPHWLINGPISLSVLVNFFLFIRIVRVLMQKLRGADIGGHDQSQYRRLAKSTLLLIPLFGVHYIVFVSLSESVAERSKIFFDLALGSFQGLVVAILYCFLNSEVQMELRRTWRSLCLNCALTRDLPLTHTVFRTTSGHMVHLQHDQRTQCESTPL
ncbi:vasoactive intestinal polypeptide receptor 2-like [Periophthalmus magnuspinnatus]|uniref:vasoactive intestinal polypeptide receptor 2-like n=1 Tax=Periophthalmus magnuspinnatus TaxID=409849 RepID=UPI0024365FD6|nr:vasoactive intestinal polypeptide receptor 2-like [Periophthalmus magnuspinnatus]